MLLVETPWERGKSGFKLIQYMACGKPVVASPVGINTEIVDDGENGYVASDHDEWVGILVGLGDETEMVRRMGSRGRELIADQ